MQREIRCLNKNWKFYQAHTEEQDPDFGFMKAGDARGLAGAEYDDSSWLTVDVPHDWAVDTPYDFSCNHYTGYKQLVGGETENRVGWYRQHFTLDPADADKLVFVEFDGVSRNSLVWVNGHYLDAHLSAYTAFRYDISDFVTFGGDNTLVVRAEAGQSEGWFYEGAGIYRNVNLIVCDRLHLEDRTVYVRPTVEGENGILHVEATVCNENEQDCAATLTITVTDAEGKFVGTLSADCGTVPAFGNCTVKQDLALASIHRWDIVDPYLYTVRLTVQHDGAVTDETALHTGFRTLRFDADTGFYLNERPVKIKGACCHQDFGGVGSAVPDHLDEYKIKLIQEMGCNAYRCAHNAPSKAVLDVCDRLGILVMDERRCVDSSPAMMRQLDELILSDRNHPCIFMWSIGNEEEVIQNTEIGERVAARVMRRIRKLDDTRPITYAGNNKDRYEGINRMVDIRGWNYRMLGDMDEYHRLHPHQPIIGTEEGSTLFTRDTYHNDEDGCLIASYDNYCPGWGDNCEGWWNFFADRPYLIGAFVWTGFDYHGEPNPTDKHGTSSQFGIMDLCGFPKDAYYYFKSWWSGEDTLHVFPHWTHPGKEGELIPVGVYSNFDEVELFCNGLSYGRQTMKRNSHLEWQVPYAAGELKAVGYRDGIAVQEDVRRTAGETHHLAVSVDERLSKTAPCDLRYLRVEVQDESGTVVPNADPLLHISVQNGAIAGVGNGFPGSTEKERPSGYCEVRRLDRWEYKLLPNSKIAPLNLRDAFSIEDWQPIAVEGYRPYIVRGTVVNNRLPVPEELFKRTPYINGMRADDYTVNHMVYRHSIFVEEDEAGSNHYQLHLDGVMGDGAQLYLNEQLLTEIAADARHVRVDLGARLKKGWNTLHVICRPTLTLLRRFGACGLIGGATLDAGPETTAERHTFHGLAMVLVKPDGTGTTTVKIEADGLPATEISLI